MQTRNEVYKLIEDHYRAHSSDLVKIYAGRCRGRHISEEMVQEAYTRALTYWESFDETKEFDKWFSQILVNTFKSKGKEERAHGSSDRLMEEIVDVQSKAFNLLIIRDVERFIAEQPANTIVILNLFFFKEYTSKEISEMVPEGHSVIRRIIQQFRKALRKKFKTRLFE